VPLTQTQLAIAVADRAEIPRAEAKRVLGALEEVVLEAPSTITSKSAVIPRSLLRRHPPGCSHSCDYGRLRPRFVTLQACGAAAGGGPRAQVMQSHLIDKMLVDSAAALR
jgi:hypothetical protein